MNTGKPHPAADSAEQVRGWLLGRLPDSWFVGAPDIVLDREEITLIGRLPTVAPGEAGEAAGPAGAGGEAGAAAEAEAGDETGAGSKAEQDSIAMGRSRRFREETRQARIAIAREAEMLFARKVSWGVVCEGRKVMFTTLSVPVMTRLRQPERRVLDTLVDAGVARSRSDALAWCVRLVGEHEDSWLADLREALRRVEQVRAGGPRA
ncbi:MAG TPA: hypothetical protein VIV12_26105 [Streptosporangiaceae bacterium]